MSEQIQRTITDPSLYAGATSPPAQERPLFDALHESAAVTETLEGFQADRLLARAVDGPLFRRSGLDFGVVDEELALMEEEGGMRHVSTTLLVAGENVRVYKPLGFLADSKRTTVEHIADQDSGSGTDNEGNLVAHGPAMKTLPELARQIRANHTRDMNEVNIALPSAALRGMFTTNHARPKLDALITRQHIREYAKGELPLFVYDNGAMKPWDPGLTEIAGLLDAIRVGWVREMYAEGLGLHDRAAIAQFAGSSVVSASQ